MATQANTCTKPEHKNMHEEVPKLTINNYTAWARTMTFMLKGSNLWDIVNATESAPEGLTNQRTSLIESSSTAAPTTVENQLEYQQRCHQAASIIRASLTALVEPYLEGATEPRAMWLALKKQLDPSTNPIRAIHTHAEFLRDRMTETESVVAFIGRIMDYMTALAHTSQAISEHIAVSKILAHLTPRFNAIRRHICEKPVAERTFDYVFSTLVVYERELEQEKASVEITAIATQSRSYRGRQGEQSGQGGKRGRGGGGGGGGSYGGSNRREPYRRGSGRQ